MSKTEYPTIAKYNQGQTKADKAICNLLRAEITKALPKAESKIWHGGPVWFIDGNPVVAYTKVKDGVQILLFSGQSFDEPDLHNEGKFKAAEKRYQDVAEIKVTHLRRWLRKAKTIQWDYKNIVKRKGKLIRL